MATEARYNKAKEEWLDAAKNARNRMEGSKQRHRRETDLEITSDSWEKWFPKNDPIFADSWNEFQQKEASFRTIMAQFDSAKAEAWDKAYRKLHTEKYGGAGEDKGSNYLIITPEI